MSRRVILLGVAVTVATNCGGDNSGDGGEAGDGGDSAAMVAGRAGGGAGGTAAQGGGESTSGGANSSDQGGSGIAGAAGDMARAGAEQAGGASAVTSGGAAPAAAGAAGEPSMGGSAEDGAGGAPESCAPIVGKMPASPTAPAAAACAPGCSVPPMDGVALRTDCVDAQSAPPASAVGVPGDSAPAAVAGLPCDTGWCPQLKGKTTIIGAESFGGPFWERVDMVLAASDVAHVARAQIGYAWRHTALDGSGTRVYDEDEPDVEKYGTWYAAPPGIEPGWYVGDVTIKNPRVGADGQGHVYLAYAGAEQGDIQPTQVVGPRFGVLVGQGLEFEDMPAAWTDLPSIQVDHDGSALVLHGGAVYRHLAGGGFERVATPCGVDAQQFISDPGTSTWYVVDESDNLYVRGSNGVWTSEKLPYAGRLLVAGGTVHVDSPTVGISHRAGTAWSAPILPPLGGQIVSSPLAAGRTIDVAVDTCWAPHYAYTRIYGNYIDYQFERVYTRWTARGFLSLSKSTGDFTDVHVVAGADHAFVQGNGEVDVFPLR